MEERVIKKEAKKIVVLGSLNVDTIQHLNKLPERGETIHLNGLTSAPGGKEANQAAAAARQGADVSFIGAVGNDANGRFMKQTLSDNKIDVSHIVTKKSQPVRPILCSKPMGIIRFLFMVGQTCRLVSKMFGLQAV